MCSASDEPIQVCSHGVRRSGSHLPSLTWRGGEVHLVRRALDRQPVLGEPPGRAVRQLVDHLEVARHLERGQLSGREARAASTGSTVAPGAATTNAFTSSSDSSDGTRDHRRLRHRRMAFERGLDLGRRQVLAPPADDLLDLARRT